MVDMFYIYILQLSDNTFYKGQTRDLDRRLNEHLLKNVKATKSRLPFRLFHVEFCESRLKARRLEKYFKSGMGREIIREIAAVVELADT